MQEKRRSIRYVPGCDITVAVRCGQREFTAPLNDLSAGGLMTMIPEQDARHLPRGASLSGEIRTPDAQITWDGQVVHQSPTSRGIAIGVAAHGSTAASMRRASEWLSQESHAGALQIRRSGSGIVLDVVGRLSFEMSRDFLHIVRRTGVQRINLSRCTSLDSAGLGMLSIARELRLPIEGARDMVKTLLDVARIAEVARA